MPLTRRMRSLNRGLDRMVDATSPRRDRSVDLLRAVAITVVVVWHWALSVTHRQDGELVMPNPIQHVPLGWLATWLLQVMPVFFIVGGYANLAAWDAVRRDGGGARQFLAKRLTRLLRPTVVFVVVWAAVEAALRLLLPGYPGVLATAAVVFVPLWFLAAYLWVVLLVPLTAAAHRRAGVLAVVALGVVVVLADLGRFAYGLTWLAWLNTALVWVLVHQLGYVWRDGGLRLPRRCWALVLGGLAALVVITSLEPYPRSLVTVTGADRSHLYPTTAGVVALAVLQTGVAVLLSAPASRWLRHRRPWKAVVAVNAVVMTLFLWHMTALLVVILAVEAAGLELPAEPTVGWWLQRPFWIVAPGVVLALLLAVFARLELPARRSGGAGAGRPSAASPAEPRGQRLPGRGGPALSDAAGSRPAPGRGRSRC